MSLIQCPTRPPHSTLRPRTGTRAKTRCLKVEKRSFLQRGTWTGTRRCYKMSPGLCRCGGAACDARAERQTCTSRN